MGVAGLKTMDLQSRGHWNWSVKAECLATHSVQVWELHEVIIVDVSVASLRFYDLRP